MIYYLSEMDSSEIHRSVVIKNGTTTSCVAELKNGVRFCSVGSKKDPPEFYVCPFIVNGSTTPPSPVFPKSEIRGFANVPKDITNDIRRIASVRDTGIGNSGFQPESPDIVEVNGSSVSVYTKIAEPKLIGTTCDSDTSSACSSEKEPDVIFYGIIVTMPC